jgi:hypothetical protein
MTPRLIAAIIFLCVEIVPRFGMAGQDLEPIPDRNKRIEIPGVSILPPQGERWFLFPVSKQERVSVDGLIRFVQRLRDAPPAKPDDARSVVASVVVTDSGEARPQTAAEFLQAFTGGDPRSLIGQMMTARQRLVGFEAALDKSFSATCVKYSRLTEITGQFPAFPNLVAILSTHGLYCSHPHWPQYHIDVTYQQIYPKDQSPLARDTDSDAFLKGVVFTSVRPSAVSRAR